MNKKTDKIYPFFANVIPVNGFQNTLLYDIQRNVFWQIPNEFASHINKNGIKNVKNDNIISLFTNQLIDNDLVFEITSKKLNMFPKMNLNWFNSCSISNITIIVNNNNIKQLNTIFLQIDEIGCDCIVFIIHKNVKLDAINIFLQEIQHTHVKTVELIMKYESSHVENIDKLIDKNQRIVRVTVYNSPFFMKTNYDNITDIIYTKEKFLSFSQCGIVSKEYFCINRSIFTESQHFNTCLNRKICIDADGEIKNCPVMNRSFGNINDITIEEALNKPNFKDLWGVRKDDIDVCKDCEFRYMCTDCRYSDLESFGKYDKPQKCLYNPYTCEWDV